jgi:uncharacterized protein
MRWTPGDRGNIDDERGRSGFGIGGGVPLGLGGFLLLLLLSWATGTNFFALLGSGDNPPADSRAVGTSGQVNSTPEEERLISFVDAVMNDVQNTWQELLPDRYQRTRVVLFRDTLQSGCGVAQSATGPFYCPSDGRVYLDLGFFRELKNRFGAPGDFAQAYVIAHEVGHHVQNLLGIAGRIQEAQGKRSRTEANALQVKMELQADCLAGVWANNAQRSRQILESSDIEEGLNAAAAIGDDRLQRQAQGRVVPESFTHGSSAQRVRWFKRGIETGDPGQCDTFTAAKL